MHTMQLQGCSQSLGAVHSDVLKSHRTLRSHYRRQTVLSPLAAASVEAPGAGDIRKDAAMRGMLIVIPHHTQANKLHKARHP